MQALDEEKPRDDLPSGGWSFRMLICMAMSLVTRSHSGIFLNVSEHQIDPCVRFNEPFAQVFVLRKNVIALHLIGGFAISRSLGNQSPRLLQHVDEFSDIGRRRNRPVPRYDLSVLRNQRQGPLQSGDHSTGAATTFHINKRKTISNKVISHVDDIGFRKEDDAIAIGVAVREVDGANIL